MHRRLIGGCFCWLIGRGCSETADRTAFIGIKITYFTTCSHDPRISSRDTAINTWRGRPGTAKTK